MIPALPPTKKPVMNTDPAEIIITTPRLSLRSWRDEDLPLMAAINADAAVMKHFPKCLTADETLQHLQRIKNHHDQKGYFLYAVELTATHEFIGFVGLNCPTFTIPRFIPQGLPVVEIGWRLSSRHWRQGYATEAARAVLDYAFTQLKLEEVISFTVVANLPSRAVMAKIGMQHHDADDFDHPMLTADSPLLRHVLYRLTRKEYLASQ